MRLTAVPRLLDFAEDATLDDQTRSWVFQALRDITGQSLPRQPAAWRDWYVDRFGDRQPHDEVTCAASRSPIDQEG